jgi:hypothetical protein
MLDSAMERDPRSEKIAKAASNLAATFRGHKAANT